MGPAFPIFCSSLLPPFQYERMETHLYINLFVMMVMTEWDGLYRGPLGDTPFDFFDEYTTRYKEYVDMLSLPSSLPLFVPYLSYHQ
jgi:hypothetical protein